MAFNFKKTAKIGAATRHSRQREPPLPVYIGLKVHGETRSKELVETLHALGVSIGYKRVLEIQTGIANSVCEKYKNDGVVVPQRRHLNEFTIGAVDNIDHNPTSTTSRDAFHGTSHTHAFHFNFCMM
jgi:hypothetical protein